MDVVKCLVRVLFRTLKVLGFAIALLLLTFGVLAVLTADAVRSLHHWAFAIPSQEAGDQKAELNEAPIHSQHVIMNR